MGAWMLFHHFDHVRHALLLADINGEGLIKTRTEHRAGLRLDLW